MYSKSLSSRIKRGLSPNFNPLSKVGRRKVVLKRLQLKRQRYLSDSSSSSIYLIPITFKRTSSSSSSSYSSSTSS